jgi:SAM-dependent methyltransferase
MESILATDQERRYADFYRSLPRVRWLFRFDVRYRCRRLHEVLDDLAVDRDGADVLDVGFGGGHLLASFPRSCAVSGIDVSRSAVVAARDNPTFREFRAASFTQVAEGDPGSLPEGPFDIIVSSHTLEHVPDDAAVLAACFRRLRPGGTLAVFVPIEEPDYNEFHRRTYSVQSIEERVSRSGLTIRHVEGSMYVHGHVWKLVTIPSRRRWPVVGKLVDGLRLGTLSAISYRGLRAADAVLYRLGFGARQALVVAQRE